MKTRTFTDSKNHPTDFATDTHIASVECRLTDKPWRCRMIQRKQLLLLVEVYGSTKEGAFLEACKQTNLDPELFEDFENWLKDHPVARRVDPFKG